MASPDFSTVPTSPPAGSTDEPGARAIDLRDRPIAESLTGALSVAVPPPLPPPLTSGAAKPDATFTNRHWTLAGVGVLGLVYAFVHGAGAAAEIARRGLESITDPTRSSGAIVADQGLRSLWWLTLGLGLIFARRWARHLWLAQAASLVIGGLLSVVGGFVAAWPAVRSGEAWQQVNTLSAWMGDFGWAIVGWLFLAVLSPRSVRLTCEAAQPKPGWFDKWNPPELCLLVLAVHAGIEAATSRVWGPVGPNRHGGLASDLAWWGAVLAFALAALISRCRTFRSSAE